MLSKQPNFNNVSFCIKRNKNLMESPLGYSHTMFCTKRLLKYYDRAIRTEDG
jgi:hypothetical protein